MRRNSVAVTQTSSPTPTDHHHHRHFNAQETPFRLQLSFLPLHGQYLFFRLESGYGTPTAAETKTGLP